MSDWSEDLYRFEVVGNASNALRIMLPAFRPGVAQQHPPHVQSTRQLVPRKGKGELT